MKQFGESDEPIDAAKAVEADGAVAVEGGSTIAEPYVEKVMEELKSFSGISPRAESIKLDGEGHQHCIWDENRFSSNKDPNLLELLRSTL